MVTLITRAEWNARPSRSITMANWSVRDAFVVHYSAGPPTQTMRQIQNYHMDTQEWSDIGYNLAVDVNGVAYEGRGWNRVPAATKDHNNHTIACLFIGSDKDVTTAAKRTIRALYDEACSRKGGPLLKRWHSYYNQTECPGNNLRSWVGDGMKIGVDMDPNGKDIHPEVPNHQILRDLWEGLHALDLEKDSLTRFKYRNPYQPIAEKLDELRESVRILMERPPVESAPVNLEQFNAAYLAALNDPTIAARIVEIANVAENS